MYLNNNIKMLINNTNIYLNFNIIIEIFRNHGYHSVSAQNCFPYCHTYKYH